MTRIVSLLPSATEIVYALGRGAELVGRSEECDFPSEARRLPEVMRVRTPDSQLSSLEIDGRVSSVRTRGESLYVLDLPLLESLAPDVILTQDLCRVCSVTDDEVRAACRAVGLSPKIVSVTPTGLEEVWDAIRVIGQAIGSGPEAARLVADLQQRTTAEPGDGRPRPTVVVVEWLDPPIVAGLWSPRMIELAGGTPWLVAKGHPGIRTDWPAIARGSPDLVVVSPCSFSVERTLREARVAAPLAGLASLHPGLGLWVADEAYFSRPGPRLADGVELLRALVQGREPPGPLPCERYLGATIGAAR